MKFSTRELVTLAVFGALWGLAEISLGSALHAIKLPLTGLSLAVAGVMIASIGRLFVPRRGSTLFIGAIAMVLKLFSLGSALLGPMLGILVEALVAELILDAFPRPSRLAFVAACAGAALWVFVHPFVTGLLIWGQGLLTVWLDMLDTGARLFGIPTQAAWAIALTLIALHLVVGGIGGWLAWNLGLTLKTRLGGGFPENAG
ncbi:conserved hypothetical protein [Candidatus Denitrolinea symbiosum]|jgi:hypothetical protein|nr:conserved hypothetical protein [Candidatus Denitrolinea symbiosum]GER80636.1 conserved hypothetical protein [Candidatus Denitrolinea symbiosum]